MRLGALALSAGLLLSACGDDGKVAREAPPAAPGRMKPGEPMPSWESMPAVAQERASATSWARTRPGDVAVWEVRLKDSPLVTRLTWRAVAVEEGMLRFEVESTSTDASGRVVSTAASRDERHALGVEAILPQGLVKPFELGEVGGQRIRQIRQAGPREDGMIITVSDQVPLGGLVRRRDGGIDQVLVSFTKGK